MRISFELQQRSIETENKHDRHKKKERKKERTEQNRTEKKRKEKEKEMRSHFKDIKCNKIFQERVVI
jgi:ribosomal protein S27E